MYKMWNGENGEIYLSKNIDKKLSKDIYKNIGSRILEMISLPLPYPPHPPPPQKKPSLTI